jgi:sterol desaturase/sphingolipid hydroxylase (fatty acid hydroxylase superfamily)
MWGTALSLYILWQGCSFAEYVVHRWLHSTHLYPKHVNHHISTKTHYLYPMPRVALGVAQTAAAVWATVSVTADVFLDDPYGPVIAYVALYNLTHLLCHFPLLGAHGLPCVLATFHYLHHRNPFCNFGVVSPTFDYLLGTLHPRIRIHSRILLLLPAPLSFLGTEQHSPQRVQQ